MQEQDGVFTCYPGGPDIVSSVSGRMYTAQDILDKFLVRGDMAWNFSRTVSYSESMYGDIDAEIHGVITSTPQMTNSPSLGIYIGHLPLHVDYAGKLSLSYNCGDNPIWESTEDPQFCEMYLFELPEYPEPELYTSDPSTWENFKASFEMRRLHEKEETAHMKAVLQILKECLLRQTTLSFKED